MSAFYCGYPHLAEMAKALDEVARRNEPLEELAATLHKENVRSLCARYSQDRPEDYDGEYARLLLELTGPRVVTDPVQLLKMVHCYDYQACETDDWKETDAHGLMRALEAALEPLLPARTERAWLPDGPLRAKGYNAAKGWPFDPDEPPPRQVVAVRVPDLPLFRSAS